MPSAINPARLAATLTELWSPRVVTEFDNSYLKFARVHGQFVWHSHDSADELFFILKGTLIIEMEDRTVTLHEGDAYVVPRGVKHRPFTESECHIILIERESTQHTGQKISDISRPLADQLRPL